MTANDKDYEGIFPYLGIFMYKNKTVMIPVREVNSQDIIAFNLPRGLEDGHVNIGVASPTGTAWLTIRQEDVENLLLACQYLLQEHYRYVESPE